MDERRPERLGGGRIVLEGAQRARESVVAVGGAGAQLAAEERVACVRPGGEGGAQLRACGRLTG